MVPSGTPGSFIAAMRQCRSDRQRQHISAAYPRNTLPWQHIDAMRPRGGGRSWQYFAVVRFRAADHGKILPRCVQAAGRGIIPPRCLFRALADGRTLAKCVRQRPTVARYRCDAFSDHRPWQLFSASCVPEGASDGKSALPGKSISPPCIRNGAVSARYVRAVHPKSAANGVRDARANILP